MKTPAHRAREQADSLDAGGGQAPVSQGALRVRIPSTKPVAAWTQRACPQIRNRCFQNNGAREQADSLGSVTVRERS